MNYDIEPKVYEKLNSVRCNSCDSELDFKLEIVSNLPIITIPYAKGSRCPFCGDPFTGEYLYHDWLPNRMYLKTKLPLED